MPEIDKKRLDKKRLVIYTLPMKNIPIKRSMFSLKIRDDLQENLRIIKFKNGQSLRYLVEEALEKYLKLKD